VTALDAEVLVVGGGPAGSTTAALLARRGHDVLLLDRAAFPREKACAEYLSPGVVDVLERIGALNAIRQADVAWPRGMRIQTQHAGVDITYPTSDAGSRGRCSLGIPRSLFDTLLLNHARASGARVQERTFVTGAVVEAGQVTGVRARAATGDTSHGSSENAGAVTLRARVVVAADGLRSAVVHSLGLERPVRWPRRLGLVARYAGVRALGNTGEMHVGHRLYCGLAPVGGDLVNVGLVGEMGSRHAGESREQLFERRLGELPGATRTLAGARRVTSVRGVGPLARRVRQVTGPGYLLVGDAAGFLDPFTGEGVYRALRGAELAADAGERALQRPDCLPVGYTAARHLAFAEKERVTWLIQLFMTSPRWFDYVLGNLARRPALGAVFGGILGDYRPARPALRPGFLAALLRP
jgi:menaquinone-9 beta-reductase